MGTELDALVKKINKDAKEEVMTLGLNKFNYSRIPFTSPRMNYCTFGGIPQYKITEFYGEEHGGKTTSALDIVANYQNMADAKDVLYVDAENSLDVEWAIKLGVDVDRLYIAQPKEQSAESIFQMIYDSVETGEVGLWVLDSIGALFSEQEYEKKLDDKTYGGISKPLTLFAKRVSGLLPKYKCTGIGINQRRENMSGYGPSITTPGGDAWKHFCSVRMQFSRGSYIDENGNPLTRSAETPAGNIVMMSMTKNKTCPPTRRTGYYTLDYQNGINYLYDLVEVAIKYDIVEKRGSWFSILDTDTGEVIADKIQGQSNVYAYLEDHDEALERLEELVDKNMGKLQ